MSLFSQRIGKENVLLSDHPTDPQLCYQWTKSGRVNSVGAQRYTCSGCRSVITQLIKEGIQNQRSAPSRFAIGVHWSKEETTPHFCEPKQKAHIFGVQTRREIQAQVAIGGNETAKASRVKINTTVTHQFGNHPVCFL